MDQENSGRILEAQEIEESEYNVMKGDTVGETLYSAKWILNTLISLTKIYEDGWNESIENDLCTLWDMTSEKDIVEFLLENDFLKMAEFTLKISEQPRLTEIIVGMIGNLCCQKQCLDDLVQREELVTIILSLLSSDDKETLIQVLRVLQAAIWDISKNPQSLWLPKINNFESFGDTVSSILRNSLCEELLTPTIDLVYLMSELEEPKENIMLKNIFDVDDLIISIGEAMDGLIEDKDIGHSEAQFKNIENWLSIIFNIIKSDLLVLSDSKSDVHLQKISRVLSKILGPYKQLNNLVPIEENCLSCIQECIKLIFTFQQNGVFLNSCIIYIIVKLMVNLHTAATEDEFEGPDDNLKHLLHYVLNFWVENLKIDSEEDVLNILQKFDKDTVNYIIKITKSFSNVPESCIVKLSSVEAEIFSTS